MLTGDGICEHCRRRVARDLDAAPGVYVRLSQRLGPTGGPSATGPITGTADRRLGIAVAVHDAMTHLADTLTTWHRVVADARDLAPPTEQARAGPRIDRAARVLAARVPDACALAPDLAALLGADVHHGRRLLGETPHREHLTVPCPECELRSLVRDDGSDMVQCRACGSAWTVELYRELVRMITTEYGMPGPT